MNPKRVVIVGGSGFIGSAIANRLCEAGVEVLIPTRRRSRTGHVLQQPNAEGGEADHRPGRGVLQRRQCVGGCAQAREHEHRRNEGEPAPHAPPRRQS